jgi:hypothetical protein
MWRGRSSWRRTIVLRGLIPLLLVAAAPGRPALALITGGEGNKPIADPGWPKGAAAIFNVAERIAWWEGPPFGGGQWHAECRGDSRAFSRVLAVFAKLDVARRRLVVHDGVGESFWLNMNHEPAKRAAARMDWSLTIWQPASWQRLSKLPASINPVDPEDAKKGPPAVIEVYTGGNVRWSEVVVPAGLEIIDQRLEAHGFAPADGLVLEGKVIDVETKQPVAARVELQRVEPQAKGGYLYPVVAKAECDAQGRWVLKKAPAGWHRVVAYAEGYVPRIAGYGQFDEQPRWQSYDCGLARSATVSGRVTDESEQPLADVDVRLVNLESGAGGRYESPHEYTLKTDADGRFQAEGLPRGSATIWLHKFGYCRPGLDLVVKTPADGVVLTMMKSARVRVTVDFGPTKRPGEYLVSVKPAGGEVVGSWGGSGRIDEHDQILFTDVPPEKYVFQGQPNPSSANQQTEPTTVELKGGRALEITLKAK